MKNSLQMDAGMLLHISHCDARTCTLLCCLPFLLSFLSRFVRLSFVFSLPQLQITKKWSSNIEYRWFCRCDGLREWKKTKKMTLETQQTEGSRSAAAAAATQQRRRSKQLQLRERGNDGWTKRERSK
jgi:hypothetical protein